MVSRRNEVRVCPARGFTLIELLVVVSLIAMLVAILIPSLARARAGTRSVVCGTNLKQAGNAEMSYASEFNGYVPRGGDVSSPSWIKLLPLQLGDRRKYTYVNEVPVEKFPVFSCPERVRTLPYPFIDYVINTIKPDIKPNIEPWDAGHMLIEQKLPSPLSKWKHPSRVLLIGDAALEKGPADEVNGNGTLAGAREEHRRVMAGELTPDQHGGLDLMDVYKPDYMQWGANRRAGTKMHMKRYCNWLWADGHVERLLQLPDRRGSGTVGGRTSEAWLRLYGVQNPNKTFAN